jgi:3-oxoacyl-[acyl-carrier-protein] synthase II
MTAVITGIGWVTAAGPGCGSQRHPYALTPGPFPAVTRKQVFAEPNQRFGRQSEYSKVGLAAIAFALRDAGLESWTAKRPVGMIAASRLGCLATDMAYFDTVIPDGGALASPNLFAYTLSTCFLGEAAIQFGLTGSALVINETAPGGLTCLRMALESLAWEECGTMLAGICDLPPPAVAPAVAPVAGAVFMVLERGRQRPEAGYGTLELAADGTIHHGGARAESFSGVVAASLAGLGR